MTATDWVKAGLEFAGTALGVLLGLLGSSYVGRRREKQAYRLMLMAIHAEASSNKTILEKSFWKYYEQGVVLREFSVATVSQYLADQGFIKYADSSQLLCLGTYLRALNLANAYRKKHEDLRFSPARQSGDWLATLITSWGENLKECQDSIAEVLKATDPEAAPSRSRTGGSPANPSPPG